MFSSILYSLIYFQTVFTSDVSTRPRIQAFDGNLIFQSAANKDVSIITSGKGRLLLNSRDVTHIIEFAQNSSDTLNQCRIDSAIFSKKIKDFEKVIGDGGTIGFSKRLEVLENQISNSTYPRNRILLNLFRRRLSMMQRKLGILNDLLITNECLSNPCSNGGTCQDMFNSYLCHCSDGWEGPRCEKDVNECSFFVGTDLGCQNGATCINKPGYYECTCSEGWFGTHCTRRSQDCSFSHELCGHGTCVQQTTGKGFKCICDQGWKTDGVSPACNVDVNECESSHPSCSVNPKVACINLPGTFHCGYCPLGYTGNGFYCSDIDECEVFNGGCSVNPRVQCINTFGSRVCGSCPPGYLGNGITCTYNGGICGVNNGGCHPLAQCRDNPRISSTYVDCVCPTSHSGNGIGPNGCILGNSDPCASNPCEHGTCEPKDSGDYVCNCNRRYTGKNCNIRKNPCDSSPCQNGGTCRTIVFSFYCICPPNYSGPSCENERQVCGRLDGPSGTLRYPPTNSTSYPNNCAWVIEASREKILNITFKQFKFQNCRQNWLQINDGLNSAAPVVGRFCGIQLPKGGTFLSTNHNLYLWYRARGLTKGSFELTWNETEPVCGGTIQVTGHGSFSSPGAPGNYPPNRDCFWRLIGPIGKRIQFQFFSLMIGYNNNCSYDYLEFLQGSETTDQSIIKYCNSSQPEPLFSPGNEVTAHFHSDSKNSFSGFQITYSLVEGIPGCGGVYTNSYGDIVSPNSNVAYPEGFLCEYKIKLPGRAKIKLTFESFAISEDTSCKNNYIAIYDGGSVDSPIIGKYCGKTTPAPIISATTEMLIVFKINWSEAEGKFRIHYERVCGGKLTSPNGTIWSNNVFTPSILEIPKECFYTIIQPLGNSIILNITSFDFGNVTTPCENGYLEIRDGENENSTLVGKYCDKAPEVIFSTYNYLWIKSVVKVGNIAGFLVKYTTINNAGCGGIIKSKVGSIESPEDLHLYVNGLTCSWLLIAPEENIIQITWVRFNMEESNGCRYDQVVVYDNSTNPGKEMGVYCGNKLPPTLISASNMLTVKLKVDPSNNLDGFMLTYNFVHEKHVCGGSYFTSSGVIKSPEYPENYPINRDCTWVLTVPSGQQIMLNITFFNIEKYFNCRYDYLEIRNGGTASSPLVGRYCGTNIPKLIPSHANQMYLRFKSDMTKTGPGFNIYWDSTATGCGGTLTSPVGTIISPHYPEPYGQNTNCIWKISISAGSFIQLIFADLDLEDHVNCLLDYVRIYDGIGTFAKQVGTYCSLRHAPPYIRSTSNHMIVKFRSDLSYQGRGFHLQYTSICKNNVSGYNGVIESPNFPNEYPHDQSCLWEINVAEGNKIRIVFSHFDVETSIIFDSTSTNCSRNYVQVKYEDPDDNSKLLTQGTYCGDVIPPEILIPKSKSVIQFVTDTLFTGNGFRLEWSLVGCGGILNHPTGILETPNYPQAYPAETRCDWVIQAEYGNSVEINFEHIDLEDTGDCSYDFIELFNGPDATYPLISKICRSQSNKPLVLTSSGHTLFLRFQSDFNYQGKGFRANYTTIPSKCGGKLTSQFGTIHSPNYPKNYNQNDSCEWFIEVEENHVINLDFTDVDLTRDCNTAYIKVYDGPTQAYPLLVKICDNAKPNKTITSRINHLFIEMVTNPYITSKGFLANYSTGCGALIKTQSSGLISYTRNMIANAESCSWTIESERPDEHIFLTITFMDSSYCSYYNSSGISIYDGEDIEAPLFGTYCGSKIPPMIKSTGSILHINIDNEELEFNAHYSVGESNCGGVLESVEGIFTTPEYPNIYPSGLQCEWLIKTSAGNKVTVRFTDFDITSSENCDEDYLEIREEAVDGKLLGVYCGNTIPTEVTVNKNILLIFKSNNPEIGETDSNGKGFRAEYSLVHGMSLSGPSGQIASPLYPRLYTQSEMISWKVTVTLGFKIAIKFLDFYTDYTDTDRCFLSYIEIFDGFDDTRPLLGTYCGHTIPDPLKTTGNIAFIRLSMELVRKGSKFLLEWQEVGSSSRSPTRTNKVTDCGVDEPIVIREGETYNLTSPSFASGGYNFQTKTCTWLFTTTKDKGLAINFESLDLYDILPCAFGENIKIYSGVDGENKFDLKETVCYNNYTGSNTIITSNLMKVVFRHYKTMNATKFFAVISEKCGGKLDDPNGIIKVDNNTFARQYKKSFFMCQWNITVRSGRTIKIEFQEFNLGEDSTNCRNYLMLKNGQYPDSPLLGSGKFCGSKLFSPVETTGNFLYIKYYSLSPLTAFKLKYTEVSINCGGKIILTPNDNSTIINSPNYPNIPSPHSECFWTVTVPNGEAVRIDFLDRFDLTQSQNCTTERVEIRSGGTKASPLIGTFCTEMPSTQVSLDNMMYIRFFTDTDEPKNGFKAKVSIASCGGIIRGENGNIKSPGFNLKKFYPTNVNCIWIIEGPKDHYLELTFKVMDLPYSLVNCSGPTLDQVIISESSEISANDTLLGTFCGRRLPGQAIRSSSNKVKIQFITNSVQKNYNGFHIFFNSSQERCGGTLSGESGIITSPGYPLMNHYNRNCEWIIRVPKGRRVKVEIQDLDFDKTMDVFSQGVAFFDGEDFSSNIIFLKTGDKNKIIRSSDNIMKVYFWSSSSSNRRGFKAFYSSNEPTVCQGNLNDDNGVIVSPNATTYKCQWERDVPRINQTVALIIKANFTEKSLPTCSFGHTSISVELDKSNVAEICQNTKSLTIRSPLPKLLLTVVYLESVKLNNFSVSYKTYPCGGVISNSEGYITSPDFPKKSSKTYECAWSLEALESYAISLQFIKFDLGEDCSKSFLIIYNGENIKSPKLGKFCGGSKPSKIQSQSNKLWIEYHFEKNSNSNGFNFTYQPVTKGCGGILHETSSVLQTPLYPNDYPKNTECLWELRAKDGYHITLMFVDRFQIESADNCENDFVQMYNSFEDEPSTKKLCGRNPTSKTFNSTGNNLFVLFRSNERVQGAGFRAKWKLSCGGTFTATEDKRYIVSPGYPEDYANELYCKYTIKAPKEYIYINFEDFELERICTYDNLTIVNTLSTFYNYGKNITYCGTNKPAPMKVPNSITFIFRTDKWVTKRGFKISYNINRCGGNITEPTMIRSGLQKLSNTQIFGEAGSCIWNITAPTNQRISLRFSFVNLSNMNCVYQFINVYDASGTLAKICGEFTEKDIPIIHSNNNTMNIYLRYRISHISDAEFQAAVIFNPGPKLGCGGEFYLTNKTSKTVNAPELNNYDCIWKFIAPTDYVVKIEVMENINHICDSKNFTSESKCDCILYEFRDGIRSNSPIIEKICSDFNSTATFFTSHKFAWIRIAGKAKSSRKIKLSVEPRICGHRELSASEKPQYITSPNFPLSYPKNIKCFWRIKSFSFTRKIELKLTTFDVNNNYNATSFNNCRNKDRLVIQEKTSREVNADYDLLLRVKPARVILSEFNMPILTQTFCSKNDVNYEFFSNYDYLDLSFYSNNEEKFGKGFKIEYQIASCNRNYTNLQGRLTKGWYIGNCTMYITVPKNYTISLYFNAFSLMFPDCSKNGLNIYDGDNSKRRLLQLCSSILPKPIFSTGNQLKIELYTNAMYAINTYDMTYTSSKDGPGCGGDFYNFKGILSSPLHPETYKKDSLCTWNIQVPMETEAAFKFTFFDLQGPCESNYVTVITYSDVMSNEHKFCKGDKPAILMSNSKITVKFKTSSSNEGTGWMAKFMSTEPGVNIVPTNPLEKINKNTVW